jgi:hypothetical protein
MRPDSESKTTGKTTARAARRPYVHQACNFCRMRKTKCNGIKPICGPCETSGHECTWGSESAKRPSTKSYVESLKNRIEALETYTKVLEKKLAQCTTTHGGLGDDPFPKPEMANSPTLAFSPQFDDDDMESLLESELDEDICAPTKHLVVRRIFLTLYPPF